MTERSGQSLACSIAHSSAITLRTGSSRLGFSDMAASMPLATSRLWLPQWARSEAMMQRASTLGRWAWAEREASRSLIAVLDHALDHRLQKGIFAGKVVEKAALAQPGPLGHRVQRHLAGADLGYDLGGRIENAGSGVGSGATFAGHSQRCPTLYRPDG